MPKRIFFLSLIGLVLLACSYAHNQEVKIQNNSSYKFEIWKADSTSNFTLHQTVLPGDFISEDFFVKGKAKHHLGKAPFFYPFDVFDSLAFEGKTLIKDFYSAENWTSFLTGTNNKGLYMQFNFSDSDLQ